MVIIYFLLSSSRGVVPFSYRFIGNNTISSCCFSVSYNEFMVFSERCWTKYKRSNCSFIQTRNRNNLLYYNWCSINYTWYFIIFNFTNDTKKNELKLNLY